jgi:hypothetical protein
MSEKHEDDIHVRIAVLEDLDGIMTLADLVHDENGMHEMVPAKVLYQVYPALIREGAICGVIGPVGGELQGVILLRIATSWYSESRQLEELVIFTHPDHRRGGRRVHKLCEFAKMASDMLGLPLQIGIMSTSRTDAKVRLYERQFGQPAGAFWLYGTKTGDTTPSAVRD